MNRETLSTVALMRRYLEQPSAETIERVRTFSATEVAAQLIALGVESEERLEAVGHWDEFRRDHGWVSLLASLIDTVDDQRGRIDAAIGIWPDLVEAGASGRLLYFYLFAMCGEATGEYLRAVGFDDTVVDATLGVLVRHARIHRRKWGLAGVDAGWWMVVTLRGELVQIKSLQFHRVNLGVGTLSPSPWYDDADVEALGTGFRRSDPSIGLHIPDGALLTPAALDATFDEARRVLSTCWPVHQRRLATCQSWLLDDQLAVYLPANSNIMGFQRRFTLLPEWVDDDADTLEFVFRSPDTPLSRLPRDTTLQRAILSVLERGGHWRARSGWFDFDS